MLIVLLHGIIYIRVPSKHSYSYHDDTFLYYSISGDTCVLCAILHFYIIRSDKERKW